MRETCLIILSKNVTKTILSCSPKFRGLKSEVEKGCGEQKLLKKGGEQKSVGRHIAIKIMAIFTYQHTIIFKCLNIETKANLKYNINNYGELVLTLHTIA